MIETVPSGTVLHGRYRIERVLGSGGFGHVYLVQDLQSNQQFALKEYLVSGPGGQEQLMHEANVLSHLHHPNIPTFQDAFSERGRYYVVINYIEGEDLTDIIRITQRRNEAVPLLQLLHWMLETCDAVIFLHNQHPPVIHRDIKPDNIRIMRNGTAILVDLGNAKAYADGLRTLLFIRHQGTPGYAPPEQYPGGSGTDARSDVYALGATLYFAITSHEPPSVSVRNQALQQGQSDLPSLQYVLAQNPAADSPETVTAKQFRLGISKPTKPAPKHSNHIAQLATLSFTAIGHLNNILQRSMALRPKDRYQYVAEFANDLRQVRDLIASELQVKPNPFSTQPDLPQLYEAIQNARLVDNGHIEDMPKAPTPSAKNNAGAHCPQCNATLMANAPFCPNCGLAFTSPVKKVSEPQIPDNMPTVVKGITSQRPIRTTDQVVTASSQSPQTPITPDVTQQDFPERSRSSASPWSTTPVTPQDSLVKARSPMSQTSQQIMKHPTPAQPALSRPRVSIGIIIAILITLLILIIIMVILIVSHLPQTSGAHSILGIVRIYLSIHLQ